MYIWGEMIFLKKPTPYEDFSFIPTQSSVLHPFTGLGSVELKRGGGNRMSHFVQFLVQMNRMDGMDGINGMNGMNGLDGIDGMDGMDGMNRMNGMDGMKFRG